MSETVDRLYVMGPNGKQICRIESLDLSTTFASLLFNQASQALFWGRGESSLAFAFNKLAPEQGTQLIEFISTYGGAFIPEGILQRSAKRCPTSTLPVALHNDLVREQAAGKVVRAFTFSNRITPPSDIMLKGSIIRTIGCAPTAIYGHSRIDSL